MTDTGFIENPERRALREAVAAMASSYGPEYYLEKARAGQHTSELWHEGRQTRLHRRQSARGVRWRRRGHV